MSIFPFIDSEIVDSSVTSKELPMFKEYAYDYERNCLLLDKEGNTFLVQGNDALRIWILKALYTPRYRFTAYSADFGSEQDDNLIGQPITKDILVLELERYIIESLMVNPYIKELSDFYFEAIWSGMKVSFCCLTVYGKENVTFLTGEVR